MRRNQSSPDRTSIPPNTSWASRSLERSTPPAALSRQRDQQGVLHDGEGQTFAAQLDEEVPLVQLLQTVRPGALPGQAAEQKAQAQQQGRSTYQDRFRAEALSQKHGHQKKQTQAGQQDAFRKVFL